MNNQDTAKRVPHKYAEVIKAWADGAPIEYRPDGQQHWTLCGYAFKPSWAEEYEYRVKPEKVYPETQMQIGDFDSALARADSKQGIALHIVIEIANAALRHAIDANQIITALDHNNALAALDHSLHAARHLRDMAIARAVEEVYCTLVPIKQRNSDEYLAAIIAKAVRP